MPYGLLRTSYSHNPDIIYMQKIENSAEPIKMALDG